MEDKELKKELDKIPDVDKNGDPIYKIDNEDLSDETDKLPDVGETAIIAEESKFQDTPQDLKDETSQD